MSAAGCALSLASLFVATTSFALHYSVPTTLRSFDQGYVVWGRLMHHKHRPDVATAVEVGKQFATGLDVERILRGIGWGMEYAYERGDLETLA